MNVVITGASSGIGKMVAKNLVAAENNLVITGRDVQRLSLVQKELSKKCSVTAVSLDLSNCVAVESFAVKYASSASILINAAADFGPTKSIGEIYSDEILQMFYTNVLAPTLLAKYALPNMLKFGFGRIIDISSNAGLNGYAERVGYSITKHGVNGLSKTINAEIKEYGSVNKNRNIDVRAYALCPGPIKGERIEKQISERAKVRGVSVEIMKRAFIMRFGHFLEPEEIIKKIITLLEPATKYNEIVVFK